MKGESKPKDLTRDELRWILEVTRRLAAPLDLASMVREVVDVARGVLDADVGMVWLHDAACEELMSPGAAGFDALRLPAGQGILGDCLRQRAAVNVPDCYADERFDPVVDDASGYRTRCMLALPLVDGDDAPVGVLAVLNRREGVFDHDDEAVALLLADQCAVALQRVRQTEQLLAAGRLRQEISVAHDVQMATVPRTPPQVPGYDLASLFRPADETGGDTVDFIALRDGRYAILMGDATGHGIGPALLATHLRAMLRVAMRLEADFDETFRHMNDQLAADLPPDRFVTAFLGVLDSRNHCVRYHSGGQGPLLHYHAASNACELLPPTSAPLGTLSMPVAPPAAEMQLEPGDVLLLASDGVYEYTDAQLNEFGAEAVATLVRAHHARPMGEFVDIVMGEMMRFGQAAAPADDLSMVLIRRLPDSAPVAAATAPDMSASFPRSLDALDAVFGLVERFFAAENLGPQLRYPVDLTVEELFANAVLHNAAGTSDIRVSLRREGDALIGSLEDFDSPPFAISATPPASLDQRLSERRPGGLGVHLIRQMMDSVVFRHAGRTSTVTFRKSLRMS